MTDDSHAVESSTSAQDSARQRYGLAVFVSVLVATGYYFHSQELANSETRWALTRAIVEEHRLSIDTYHAKTIDKALVDGHYFCDKAPGASLWGVPVYWIVYQANGLIGRTPSETDSRYLTRLWVASLPTTLVAWLLFRVLCAQSVAPPGAAAVALVYGLGTCAWPYAVMIYGHQLAAMFTMLAFALCIDWPGDRLEGPSALRVAGAGLCIGAGVMTEYPVVFAGAALGCYLLWRCRPFWRAGLFAMGGVPAALVLAAYNTSVFGGPLKSGYDFEAVQQFQQGMQHGVAGITYPKLDALWLITGSLPRGLFSGSPALLLCVPGLVLAWRYAPRRAPWVLAAVIGLTFLLFNAAYYMPDGGAACGPRHLLPAVPLIALLTGGVLLPGRSAWWQVALLGLAIPGVLRHLISTAITPHLDPGATNPWLDVWWPLLRGGYQASSPLARFGWPIWLATIGLAFFLAAVWVSFLPIAREQSASERQKRPRSLWRNPAAIGLVIVLAALGLAPHVLVPPTPGAMQPLICGMLLNSAGLKEAAARQFAIGLQIPPTNDEEKLFAGWAWYYAGRTSEISGKPDEAAAYLANAVALQPREAEFHHAYGVVLAALNRWSEARVELDEAVRLDPSFADKQAELRKAHGATP